MSREPLRILMVLRAPVGGLYRHVIDLTEELSQRGHEIGLVMDSSLCDPQTEKRLKELTIPPELGVHRIPIPRLLGFGDLSAALRIRAIAKEHNIDVLHGHGAKGGFNARLACLGINSKVSLYTPHGGVLHFAPSSMVGKVLRTIERLLLGVTHGVIFESAFAKRAFETQIKPVRCLSPVVHNGLLPHEFSPLDKNLVEFDFAYVGEIRKLKGIHNLLDALVDITSPDGKPATLIIGGGGPEEAMIRKQIQNLGLSARTKMVGVQPALEVFGRGRIAVMPSLAESLPYVALEAAAAGKPLLATDVGGVKEIFGPTASSLLPPSDSVSLAKSMQFSLDNPEKTNQEMQTRLAWILANFSISKMAVGIEDTYFKALEQSLKKSKQGNTTSYIES